MINLILATDKAWGIGNNNDLLYHFKGDLARFKKLTTGNTVVMGRKTWESLPKKLPNRTNIVISSTKELDGNPDFIFTDIEPVLKMAESEEIWVIGGAAITKLFLPYIDRIELTMIDNRAEADIKVEFMEDALKDYILVGEEKWFKECSIHGQYFHFGFQTYTKK